MFCTPRILLVGFLITFASIVGLAQNAPTPGNRPKLGLVLEGGGALGLAVLAIGLLLDLCYAVGADAIGRRFRNAGRFAGVRRR